MSRSKDLRTYPDEYMALANRIQGGSENIITLRCDSERAAKAKRLDLYGFRAALEASGMAPDYPRLFAVRMYVRGRNLELIHAEAL